MKDFFNKPIIGLLSIIAIMAIMMGIKPGASTGTLYQGSMTDKVKETIEMIKQNQIVKSPLVEAQKGLAQQMSTNSGAIQKIESENSALVYLLQINGYEVADWNTMQIKKLSDKISFQ